MPTPSSQAFDGRGSFLAPGLADRHTHVDDPLDFPWDKGAAVDGKMRSTGFESCARYRATKA
jgi:hypothetical protein